jgi:hypothetical protein
MHLHRLAKKMTTLHLLHHRRSAQLRTQTRRVFMFAWIEAARERRLERRCLQFRAIKALKVAKQESR